MRTSNFLASLVGCLVSSTAAFGVVADPAFNPTSGSLDAAFSLTISCATPGAEIHYTLNGADPTLFDPAYVGTLTINRNWTVKAKAWLGAESSNTVSTSFEVSGSVSAGKAHSLALKGHGPVVAWGMKDLGRLGNNQTASGNILNPTPSLYSVGSPISNGSLIATGSDHSVFLRNDNTVWGFGYNNKGQLGNNSTTNSGLAVQVRKSTTPTDYLTGCVSVAAGTGFTIAAHSGGQVYAWGDQELGRLGNGSAAVGSRGYAGVVYQGTGTTPLSGIKWVAAGGASALGLNPTTGKAWAWGQNSTGQLGQGTTGNNLIRAAAVKQTTGTDLTDVTDIACGGDHSAFVRWKTGDPNLQGRVFCVGKQQYGRLGDNITTNNTYRTWANQAVLKAVGVPLENVVQVAAGPAFTLALDSSGKVWAWGRNQYGALGRGNTTNSALAVAVKKPDGTGQLEGITRIAAGGFQDAATTPNHQSFALAVATDGTVYAWGYNGNGQLGNGSSSTTTPVTLPTAVTGLDLTTYPDVTLACEVTQAGIPGSVILKASPVDPDNNITKVEFFQQGVLVGEATSAPWEIPVNNLAQGTYHNYAVVTDASGYKGYSNPIYFDVTWPPPVVTLSSTVTNGVAPGSVTLSAVPSDPNNAITKVEFFSQETLLGERTGPPWTFDLTNLVAGNYLVSAKVTNAVGQVGTSSAAYFTIGLNPSELLLDSDGDGLSAEDENLLGTSDQDPDSDGDGVPDNTDGTPRVPNSLNFTASALLVTSPLR